MNKSAPARFLVGPLLVLQLTLLAGCNSQPESPQATPALASKAVQATAAPTTSTSSANPTDTAGIPAPLSTRADPTTAADLATKLAENPPPTPGPTVLPSRGVAWLVDLLRASQAMTITAIDKPQMHVSIDQAGRKQLAEDVQSGTVATVSGDEWLDRYLPFPGYWLDVNVPPAYEVRLHWASPTHLIVMWINGPDDNNPVVAYYIQENSALWNAVSGMAPVAHYPESSLRYLLDAGAMRIRMGEYDYTLTGEWGRTINVARVLAYGALTKDPAPEEEPMITLYFTVKSVVYEVKVWGNYFTYDEHTYQLENVGPQVRGVLTAD